MSAAPSDIAKSTENSGKNALGIWLTRLGPLLGLAVVFILFAALQPNTFLRMANLQLMLLQTTVVGTAALGMTLIIITGGIDLSVGSTIALTTVVLATLLAKFAGAEPADGSNWIANPFHAIGAAVGGIMVASLCGLVIGFLITQLRLLPFIVTLGTWGAIRGLAKGAAHETMVQTPESWLNTLMTALPAGKQWMLVPPSVWIYFVLAVLVSLMLRYTCFGRHVFAVGSNDQTARLCGVRVEKTKMLVYALAGLLFGVAGVLQFAYLTLGDPTTANGMELNIIAAVVIGGASLTGGRGTVTGSIIGALLMTVVANGCTKVGMSNWVQEIVTGCIIIAAAAIDRLRQRTR